MEMEPPEYEGRELAGEVGGRRYTYNVGKKYYSRSRALGPQALQEAVGPVYNLEKSLEGVGPTGDH
jgi:predicted HD phosphohydrolase